MDNTKAMPVLTRKAMRLLALLVGALIIMLFLEGSGPTYAEAKTLRISVPALPQEGLNPLYNSNYPAIIVLPSVFDSLTVVKSSGEVKPSLAISWQQLDALTWRFQLRPDVYFSNGESLDSYAIKQAFDYLKSPRGASTVVARTIDMVERSIIVDSLTIDLVTNRPEPRLPWHLTGVRFPAPKHWMELGPEKFGYDPIGTGPYKQIERAQNKISLSAFSNSWRSPKVEFLELNSVPTDTSRLQALQTEAMDISVALSPDDHAALSSLGGQIVVEKSPSILGLGFFATESSPVNDPRVRRALNFAVNRPAILSSLYGGVSKVTSQVVVSEAFGFVPELEPYPYDPERAKSLLKEAGYEDGFDLPIEVNTGMGGNASSVFQQVSADLARVGVRAILTPLSVPMFVEKIINSSWGGLAFTIDYNVTTALDGLRPFKIHSCLRRVPWFCDEGDTSLILAAENEEDLPTRLRMTQELVGRYYEDPPGIILFEAVSFVGGGPRVQSYNSDFGVIAFEDIEISK